MDKINPTSENLLVEISETRGAGICPGRETDAQKVERGVMPCSLGGPRRVDMVRWPIQIERADGK